MKVKVARKAGFCMGVGLALEKLDKALVNSQTPVFTLGPIIHNPQVLEEYREKGVKILNSTDEIEKETIVVIRAHGISISDEKKALNQGAILIDATCPKVKAAQLAVAKATEKITHTASHLLLFGEEEHPEVRGLVSYSHIPYTVFSNLEDLKKFLATHISLTHLVLASQTTQDKDEFAEIIAYLNKNITFSLKILNTICNATKERQDSVRELAPQVDVFIVVGGKESGNTKRLAEIASTYSIPVYLVESAKELKKENFEKNLTFALTAGASTPKRLIEEVRKYLEQGYTS